MGPLRAFSWTGSTNDGLTRSMPIFGQDGVQVPPEIPVAGGQEDLRCLRRDAAAFVYHCFEKDLDLHPCCASLQPTITIHGSHTTFEFYNRASRTSLRWKRFVLAAKIPLCWRVQHPPCPHASKEMGDMGACKNCGFLKSTRNK
jgi:hypothetical protein